VTSSVATSPLAPASSTSLFVSGQFPARRRLILLLSVLAGLFVAYAWSATLVDEQIGFNTADTLLGHNANSTPIGGIASGVLFAFVSGLAGSFTACNIACFGAVGPLVSQQAQTRRGRLVQTLRPLGWLAVGMITVSAVYGAIVGIVGTRMPQFSTAHPHGLSPRAIQSMTAFGVVGLIMIVLGMAALGLIRDPLGPVSRRYPNAPLVLVGALIGGFLIGRPYPLFQDMFRSAAQSHDPLYGAVAFALQSVGNIIVMSLLFLLLSYGLGSRVQRWIDAKPSRASVLTAAAFIIAGVFAVVYWDVRALNGIGDVWFPTAPWN
jgi:hypothetical protein